LPGPQADDAGVASEPAEAAIFHGATLPLL
jgi:hypothetical protein